MRLHRPLGTIFVAAALACSALAWAAAPKGKPSAADKEAALTAARMERGAYLVRIMGCGDCHTPGTLFGSPDTHRELSGSEVGWKGPWGISFARNLTPDAETGIGYYSAKELVDAMRTGTKPDGSPMLPPMPWQNLVALSDEDAYSVATYLLNLKPVKHEVPRAVPPGQPWSGAVIELPPPPAWDAPRPHDHSHH